MARRSMQGPRQGHGQTDEDKYQAALTELRRQYYADVRSLALDLIERAKDEQLDAEAFDEAVHQDVDSNQWVIYTHMAKIACLVSDNEDAIFEDMGGVECDGSVPYSQIAFFAMRQDVLQALETEGFDYNKLR